MKRPEMFVPRCLGVCCVQEVRESRRRKEQRIVEVDSGVRQDYEFKLAQALQV